MTWTLVFNSIEAFNPHFDINTFIQTRRPF